jgi:hypothetical protein
MSFAGAMPPKLSDECSLSIARIDSKVLAPVGYVRQDSQLVNSEYGR